jgi:hypothetical protein
MDDDTPTGQPRPHFTGGVLLDKLFVGIAFLLVGLLFTLHTLRILEVGSLTDWWPLLLVAVGLAKVVQPGSSESRGWGIFLVVFFGFWLLHNLDIVLIHPFRLWPLILLFIGGTMIWRAMNRTPRVDASEIPPAPPVILSTEGQTPEGAAPPPPVASVAAPSGPATADTVVNATALLGAVKRRSTSRDFRGGYATAVMGGCEIDLRDAAIACSPVVIETFAWWGGIEIKVPREWTVVTEGTAILGAFEDKTTQRAPGGQTLVVRGVVIMGGVEIKD